MFPVCSVVQGIILQLASWSAHLQLFHRQPVPTYTAKERIDRASNKALTQRAWSQAACVVYRTIYPRAQQPMSSGYSQRVAFILPIPSRLFRKSCTYTNPCAFVVMEDPAYGSLQGGFGIGGVQYRLRVAAASSQSSDYLGERRLDGHHGGRKLGRGLHSLTSKLNLSNFGTHPRIHLSHVGDKVSSS
jgi:hypothetical protein